MSTLQLSLNNRSTKRVMAASLACLCTVGTLWADEKIKLKVAVARSLAPPFVLWNDNRAVGGIDIDIANALAAQLNTQVEFITLPRLRVEAALSSGEAHISCNLSPLSNPRTETLSQSRILFDLQDMLAGHSNARPVDKPEQIDPGSVIGTLQAQSYVALDPMFTEGRLKRDDALDEERLLTKLAKERHPYGVGNWQVLSRFGAKGGESTLASWRVPLGYRPYRCSFSTRGSFEATQLNAALGQLQTSGKISQIFAQHSPPPLAVVVSTQSEVRDISRAALLALFMGQSSLLGPKQAAEPVMSQGPERQQFFSAILQREPAQFRSAWAAQQFGGRRRTPLELASAEAVKQHLQQQPRAVGFLPMNQVDNTLRIIFLP